MIIKIILLSEMLIRSGMTRHSVKFLSTRKHIEYKILIHIIISIINISDFYKRNNRIEKGNLYCDYNMIEDYNTGSALCSRYRL